MMIDTHIHIGQFEEVYYKPLDILRIVTEAGISAVSYSSTTSCKDSVCYKDVEMEIAEVSACYTPDSIIPFLWYIPAYIDEGITALNAFQNLPYGGIKLHPRAHRWNLHDRKHLDCLHGLFEFTQEHGLPVLIHTGENDFERPAFFKYFFEEYQKTKFILAHCRPVTETIALFQLYKNVYGDTAFLSVDSFDKITKAGFNERLLPGSDFPITHYYKTRYPRRKDSKITLQKQYLDDLNKIFGVDSYFREITAVGL